MRYLSSLCIHACIQPRTVVCNRLPVQYTDGLSKLWRCVSRVSRRDYTARCDSAAPAGPVRWGRDRRCRPCLARGDQPLSRATTSGRFAGSQRAVGGSTATHSPRATSARHTAASLRSPSSCPGSTLDGPCDSWAAQPERRRPTLALGAPPLPVRYPAPHTAARPRRNTRTPSWSGIGGCFRQGRSRRRM